MTSEQWQRAMIKKYGSLKEVKRYMAQIGRRGGLKTASKGHLQSIGWGSRSESERKELARRGGKARWKR